MSTSFVVICVIGVLFFTHTQDTFAKQTRQEVESQLICISKWQTLKLNWNFTVTSLSTNQNFNSFWSQNKEDFKRQTIKRLSLTVIYRRNITKTFSCHGTVASYTGPLTIWRNNISVDVQLPNVGSELLGVRFISLLDFERRLEFYIRPRANINDVSYTLHYCFLSFKYVFLQNVLKFQKNYTCPRHRFVKFSCSQRENNVYKIPDSTGIVCEASTKEYAYGDANYNFYIRSEIRDGSCSVTSHDFRIFTTQSSEEPISRYANQGLLTALLIGAKPSFLNTITTEQRVVLSWENTGAITYRITYTCTNGFSSNQTNDMTTLTIYNKTFTPYTLCKFCVASQNAYGSIFSEPMCNTTRFPEKAPSKPPTITCDFNTCPTTIYDQERAVTVKCILPKLNTTNGLLNKLVLNYWNDSSKSGDFEKFVITNLTLCEVRLTNLSNNHEYFAQMSVCNSKGCSGLSDQVLIAKAVLTNSTKARRSVISKLWLGLVIPIPTVVLITAIILSVKRHRRLTQPNQDTPLPRIEEPNNYEHLETNSGQQLHQYDELSKEDENRNGFDNSCQQV